MMVKHVLPTSVIFANTVQVALPPLRTTLSFLGPAILSTSVSTVLQRGPGLGLPAWGTHAAGIAIVLIVSLGPAFDSAGPSCARARARGRTTRHGPHRRLR